MADEDNIAEVEATRIPAQSRQQAMDWSLVLASQAIPHLIASPDESGIWSLRVAPADFPDAAAAIGKYEAENAPRPWQQPCLEGRLLFDWAALVWVLQLTVTHALSTSRPAIKEVGIMHGTAATHGEWWRLVTATQLHADGAHLASNLSIGFVLLALVMGRWGTATGMLAALVAGVGGNVFNWLLQPAHFSLGASGVVMGCLGLLALQPRRGRIAQRPPWRGLFGGLAGAVMLFVLLGLDPRADVVAHAGGFITGLALALGLRLNPIQPLTTRAEWIAALLLAGLVLAPWSFAAWHASFGK